MKSRKIAVFGYGTVGRGVADAVERARKRIQEKTGVIIDVAGIYCRSERPEDPRAGLLCKDGDVLLNDPAIDMIIECMGGVDYAYEVTKQALSAGKAVVTSNKALVAAHGTELMRLAAEHGTVYAFEAAVGGGIPLLRTLQCELRSNRIASMAAILNGTTNYILTEMGEHGLGYEAALEAARDLGYAEADPTDDVEGYDTLRKLAILGSMITGDTIAYEAIPCRGITDLEPEDFSWAEEMHYRPALLAHFKEVEEGYSMQVSPFYLPEKHPLSMVRSVYNAAAFRADLTGDFLLYGEGAGGLATASAVLADILHLVLTPFSEQLYERKLWNAAGASRLLPAERIRWRYAFRFGRDRLKGRLFVKRLLNESMEVYETKGGAPGTLAVTKAPISGFELEELRETLQADQYLPIYEDWNEA